MKLLLFAVFFINAPISCLDGLTSSLKPVAPIIKPVGKAAVILYSSMTPLVDAVKMIPSWGKKEIRLEEKLEKANLNDVTSSKEEIVINKKTVEILKFPIISQARKQLPQEAVVLPNKEEVIEQEDLVIEIGPVGGGDVLQEAVEQIIIPAAPPPPQLLVDNLQQVQVDPILAEIKSAIDKLKAEVNKLGFTDFTKKPKQPLNQELDKIKELVKKHKKHPSIISINPFIPTINVSLRKIVPNYANNQQEKEKILTTIQEMKNKIN